MDKRILFICSANCDRSPTAEAIYKQYPGIVAKSTGIYKPDKTIRGCLIWANVIVVMEKHHREYIRSHFPNVIADKPVYTLNIPDEYLYMQDSLIDLIKERMKIVFDEVT